MTQTYWVMTQMQVEDEYIRSSYVHAVYFLGFSLKVETKTSFEQGMSFESFPFPPNLFYIGI